MIEKADDWQPAIVAAIIAFVTALITSGLTALLAERRFRQEFKLQYKAEGLAKKLLNDPRYRLRTFKTLKHHLGGFEEDELRRVLVQAGAIRFEDGAGIEVWGLWERCSDIVEGEYFTASN